jgi:hypothetical protein
VLGVASDGIGAVAELPASPPGGGDVPGGDPVDVPDGVCSGADELGVAP